MQCRIYHKLPGLTCWAVLVVCTSCRQQMADQPRYDVYQESTFYADKLSARPLPQGVVSRNSVIDEVPEPGQFPSSVRMTMDLLRRGRQRFDIYCVPCHGYTGKGDGIVTLRGLRRPPPSFHSDRLRNLPPSYFYDVIQNGFGAMPSYAYQVAPSDRWAIIAYIRALQLSQWAPLDDVPQPERQRLEAEPR